MVEHLSDLALDEATDAAQRAKPPPSSHTQRHLQECLDCQGRLQSLQKARTQAIDSAYFEKTYQRLRSQDSAPDKLRWTDRFRWLFWAIPVAAAASILLVLSPTQLQGDAHGTTRLKGAASVGLVRLSDQSNGPSFQPGEQVVLQVGPAGFSHALVLGVDNTGTVSQLWPLGTAQSGAVPPGTVTRLAPPFEVTPGALTLHAFFSETPIESTDARRALDRAVAAARRSGGDILQAEPEPLVHELGRARMRVTIGTRGGGAEKP